ncbi:MAG: hypothetical protein OXH68_03735 [Gammaproteobacteria bacterium]|nr:hypothetical protein [Gammaproteobacteria bacterium]
MLPDPVGGFVERPELVALSDPSQRQLTVIQAPGGFGKTTLLAGACRRVRSRRAVAAWLTIDEEDDAAALATYLLFAFSEAGLEILESRVTNHDFEHGDYRVNLLMHSIEVRGFPCVLALDDVDRLQTPESRAVVNRLLQRGPANLHLALAFREPPAGIDVATPILDGRGVAISVEDLRFTKPEIARFFDTRLSRRELAALHEVSRGWPIALRIHRNTQPAPSPGSLQDLASNWIEARLWRGLSQEDQDFVLDIGLFEWIEAELVDEVLPAGSVRRIQSISALSGLLHSVGGTSDEMYLHPLIRQHCADKRLRDTPERYRSIHRAIADALARRGQPIPAIRHATEAGDSHRVGEILEEAGGSRFWLRGGMTRMLMADELLTPDILSEFPRLGLLRCMALVMAGRFTEADKVYADLDVRTDGFTRDREGGNDQELRIDDLTYRYLLATCGCRRFTSVDVAAWSVTENPLIDQSTDPLVPSMARFAIGAVETAKANFDHALRLTNRARVDLVRKSQFVRMYVDFRLGVIGMAEGRVADAVNAYARVHRAAKNDFLQDAGPSVIAEVLSLELNLERNRMGSLARRTHKAPALLARCGAWQDVYMAAAEATAELAVQDGGPDAALDELDETIRFAARTERITLLRGLQALRVSLLVADGRTEDARGHWERAGFPQAVGEIVDLESQTWREMEAIASAGLRLLAAESRFTAARELAVAMLSVCARRGLKRTLMRARVLGMVLEHRAGEAASAANHLVEYLQLYSETDYSRPLVKERETGLAVIGSVDDWDLEERLRKPLAYLTGLFAGSTSRAKYWSRTRPHGTRERDS